MEQTNTLKRIGKVSFIVLLSIFVLSILFMTIIMVFLPEKNITINMGLGELTNVVNEEEKDIITINYYSNSNNDGIELFEVKLNGYVDNTQINEADPITYAKGVQFIGTSKGSIKNSFTFKSGYEYFDFFSTSSKYKFWYETSSPTYYYDRQGGVSFDSVNNLSNDSMFRVTMQNDNTIYLMKFLGTNGAHIKTSQDLWQTVYYYIDYDINYLSYKLLNAVSNNSKGYTSGKLTINLEDLFMFAEERNGTYTDFETSKTLLGGKIHKEIFEYFSIRFNYYESGAKNSSDSIFGMISGQFNYSTGLDSSDYLYGNQVMNLNEYNFDFILEENSTSIFTLKLNDKTKEYLTNNSDLKLAIQLDLDTLKDKYIIIYGFNQNSGLSEFKDRISSIKLIQNGVDKEVEYDTLKF